MTDTGLSNSPPIPPRHFSVDVLRGGAIVLMVLFHFGYDLSAFGYADYDTNYDIEWRVFRAIIVSGFLLAVGMSSYLAYAVSCNSQKLVRATLKLLLVAGFITVSSYLMYPKYWVYFGIIHFIALALPLSILFLRAPTIALVTGLMLITGYFSDVIDVTPAWRWSVENLGIPEHTVDLVSFVPWFGLVLIGIFIMHYRLLPQLRPNKLSAKLAFLGQHSLLIYLVHQPILYSCFYLLAFITE